MPEDLLAVFTLHQHEAAPLKLDLKRSIDRRVLLHERIITEHGDHPALMRASAATVMAGRAAEAASHRLSRRINLLHAPLLLLLIGLAHVSWVIAGALSAWWPTLHEEGAGAFAASAVASVFNSFGELFVLLLSMVVMFVTL